MALAIPGLFGRSFNELEEITAYGRVQLVKGSFPLMPPHQRLLSRGKFFTREQLETGFSHSKTKDYLPSIVLKRLALPHRFAGKTDLLALEPFAEKQRDNCSTHYTSANTLPIRISQRCVLSHTSSNNIRRVEIQCFCSLNDHHIILEWTQESLDHPQSSDKFRITFVAN